MTRKKSLASAKRYDRHLAEIVELYDEEIMYDPFHRAYMSHSGFSNFGYWDAKVHSQAQACERQVAELVARWPRPTGRVLDVACGMGGSTHYLARYTPARNITGINISEKQLRSCRERAPGSTFKQMDATQLDLEDDSFNNVLCVEAAFHFRPRSKFLSEAFRVLAPGGGIALSDILYTDDKVTSAAAYKTLLQQAGFTRIKVEDVTDACWNGFCRHVTRYALDMLLAGEVKAELVQHYLEKWVFEIIPTVRSYLFVSAQKPKRAGRSRRSPQHARP